MDKAAVERWLEAYVSAWHSRDRAQIEDLFAADVTYRYHPYDDPVEGRDAVVDTWLGEGDSPGASTPDQPGTFDATYRAVAVEDSVAVATGSTRYRDEPGGPVTHIYDNCFVMRFNQDGCCVDFVEWYMKRPAQPAGRKEPITPTVP